MIKKIAVLFIYVLCATAQITVAQEQKTITGNITYDAKILSNVHVINTTSKIFTKTDEKGNYRILANTGDEITYSFVGLKTMTVVVEDVTSILNIKMTEDINQLDDVVVKAKVYENKPEIIPIEEAVTMEFLDPNGKRFKPARSGGVVHYFTNEDMIKKLTPGLSLEQALNGCFSGVTIGQNRLGEWILYLRGAKATIDYDGEFFRVAPAIEFSEVVQMFVMMKEALIVIRTKSHPDYIKREKERVAETYKNQNRFDSNSVTTELDFSQNDLPVNLGQEKEVYGKITHQEYPVADVTVSLAGKQESRVFSNVKGEYRIKAQVGDIIQFSHVSFETVSIFVEDITDELNIDLKQKVNELNEVVVETKGNGNVLTARRKKVEAEFQTSRGKENPKASGYSQSYIDGEKLTNVYENIQQAIAGKIPGYRYDQVSGNGYLRGEAMSMNQDYPVAWEVDGVFTTYAPPLDLSQIKSIRALKALGATTKYGSQAVGGVIIIETTFGNFVPEDPKKKAFKEEYANSNFYNNDASIASLEMKGKNKFAEALVPYANKNKAFQYYQEVLKKKIRNYGDHLSVAMKFIEHYKDSELATKILDEQALQHSNNPEVLKAIAFHYQWLDNKRSAIKVYERLFKLRPKHAQSFRDLANAYADYDLYKKAWKLYYTYMLKGKVTSEEGIGETMYNEMEWLYYQRSSQTQIKQKFVPINETAKDFQRDIKMVFEWNTSEAEFELEFVSPDKRAYSFDHSLAANNDLIIDEKKVGYSSKMFEIEDLGTGDWLINLTYKGNKKNLPSFFKLTTFYNWGRPNEKKVVKVYKLEIQNQKAALLRFNKEIGIAQK